MRRNAKAFRSGMLQMERRAFARRGLLPFRAGFRGFGRKSVAVRGMQPRSCGRSCEFHALHGPTVGRGGTTASLQAWPELSLAAVLSASTCRPVKHDLHKVLDGKCGPRHT